MLSLPEPANPIQGISIKTSQAELQAMIYPVNGLSALNHHFLNVSNYIKPDPIILRR
jgi:hypothetical protein